MSRPTRNTITCRGCGQPQEFTAWDSLNVTLDPDKKGELLRGELTRFTCSQCGWSSDVVYPLLYHDMHQQVMIWLVPPGGKAETGNLPGRGMRDYRFRLVSNRHELVEKVLLFDAEIDDRAVECFKAVLRFQSAQEGKALAGALFFDGVSQGADRDWIMAFAHVQEAGGETLEVPFLAFEQMRTSLAGRLPAAEAERGQWLTVNADYAAQMLGNSIAPD